MSEVSSVEDLNPFVRLGDLVHIKHGFPFKSELFNEELTGLPIIVSIGNFRYTGGFRFDETTVKEYRGTYPKDYELQSGDILLVMTCQTPGGEILGIPATVPNDQNTYLHNQRLGKIENLRPDLIDNGYLYWLCLSSEFNRHLVTTASGSKILHTSPSRIEDYRFELPPLPVQREIAHILGSLDDKIDLNRRMNATLESMARALFKSWFVDFDPVRAKAEGRQPDGMDAETAALFPDSFEDSELGEIPAGWRVGSLSDMVDILSGGTPKTSIAEYWDGDIPWFSVKDVPTETDIFVIDTEKKVSESGIKNSATKILPRYTTIISARGTVGKLALTAVPMTMNQSCYGLRGKNYRDYFVFFAIRETVAELQRNTHGTVFDTITRETFDQTRVILPPFGIADGFHCEVETLMMKIENNLYETQTLIATRESLLPRLMAGEMDF